MYWECVGSFPLDPSSHAQLLLPLFYPLRQGRRNWGCWGKVNPCPYSSCPILSTMTGPAELWMLGKVNPCPTLLALILAFFIQYEAACRSMIMKISTYFKLSYSMKSLRCIHSGLNRISATSGSEL